MKTCDTCKWWGDAVYTTSEDVIEWIHDCTNPKNDGPMYEKDESYVIFSAAKFGCVHHEPK